MIYLRELPSLRELRAERARRSLWHFLRQAWPYIEPGTEFVDGMHLHAICEHLQAVRDGQIRRLIINVPPRHAKSITTAVAFPAWVWATDPSAKWLTTSYALSLSTRDNRRMQSLIQSPWYQENWGDKFSLTVCHSERTENSLKGHRIATSVDGSNTGEGGDYILIDDPHNVKMAESEAKRESVVDFVDGVLATRLNNPNTGRIVLIMQRVHQKDAAGHLLEQGGYEHLMLPAEFEPERRCHTVIWQDPRKEAGELLWPERWNREAIGELKRRLGSYRYAGQAQQRPAPSEGGIIKRHWWRFYKERPQAQLSVISVDAAFKDSGDSSYVAIGWWDAVGPDRYLRDQIRERMGFIDTLRAIRQMIERHGHPNAILIEDKANGPAIIEIMKKQIGGVIPFQPQGSKNARVEAVSPQIEAGNVYLPEGAAWVDDYLNEWSYCPNGEYWDQIDQTTQALLYLRERTGFSEGEVMVFGNLVTVEHFGLL